MIGRVLHAKIPIDDSTRAGAFHREVSGWEGTQWGPSVRRTLSGDEPGPGAEGGVTICSVTPEGVVSYVDDIDEALSRVVEAGGTPVTDRMPIPTRGWMAHLRDSEGDLIGLSQANTAAGMPAALGEA
ncbi:VOC family protein [Cryobacterium sinapicolor]|uniref:VOC family protein n=1 Tax=Cryobacterium sinapicolor TaxID=1259236 RepID=A0ABY2J291_9MICO|nr:VOC family protein [Cryobacterium sinapicolor]TFC98178.1 VOC family protein [Cryobacterium sinapicolor]